MCPYCRSKESSVVESWTVKITGVKHERRKCDSCSKTWVIIVG